jgi:hypothetical protein
VCCIDEFQRAESAIDISTSTFLKACQEHLLDYEKGESVKLVTEFTYQDAGDFLRCLFNQVMIELPQDSDIMSKTFYSKVVKQMDHICEHEHNTEHQSFVTAIDVSENACRTADSMAAESMIQVYIPETNQEEYSLSDLLLPDAVLQQVKCPVEIMNNRIDVLHKTNLRVRLLLSKCPKVLVKYISCVACILFDICITVDSRNC